MMSLLPRAPFSWMMALATVRGVAVQLSMSRSTPSKPYWLTIEVRLETKLLMLVVEAKTYPQLPFCPPTEMKTFFPLVCQALTIVLLWLAESKLTLPSELVFTNARITNLTLGLTSSVMLWPQQSPLNPQQNMETSNACTWNALTSSSNKMGTLFIKNTTHTTYHLLNLKPSPNMHWGDTCGHGNDSDGSGGAGCGDEEGVLGVPVAVPDHEAAEGVVVVLEPLLEGGDDVGSHVVVGAARAGRRLQPDQQLVALHACEVGDGFGPIDHALQVPPVQVHVLDVIHRPVGHLIPVVVGLRLVVVDGQVRQLDDRHEVIVVPGRSVRVGDAELLHDGHVLGRDDDELVSAQFGTQVEDHVGDSAGSSQVILDVEVDAVQAVFDDDGGERVDEVGGAGGAVEDIWPVTVLSSHRNCHLLPLRLPGLSDVRGEVGVISNHAPIGLRVHEGQDDGGD